MEWRISADTGGTFTDAFAVDPKGRTSRCKVLSSGVLRARVRPGALPAQLHLDGLPDLPAGLLRGFCACAGAEQRRVLAWDAGARQITLDAPFAALPERIDLTTGEEAPVLAARVLTGTPADCTLPPIDLRLATTRATNALLERKGSPVALFITAGFGDLLRLGDQRRADLFALRHVPRPCFVESVVEVKERMGADGTRLISLDDSALRRDAQRLRSLGLRHAAVALLHSHAHPEHERRVAALLQEVGFEQVSLSSEVAAFARILPRTQSAVADAYLTGPVQAFLAGVAAPLGAGSKLSILTSAGALEAAREVRPKDLLLSGPAGGALGAANAAVRAGFARVLTLDMGGTSTDVARIEGRPGLRFSQEVAGLRLLAPCVAIETVAAGGGSICRWTPQGLAVGPESAGADPGPACYGRGGPLTITDVNLLLDRFDPARAPIPLDVEAARQRLNELHAASDGRLTPGELLRACLCLAVEHMASAIRRISVAEGYDPRDHALLAFGGAGPQHACAVAERLGMTTVLAPAHAGILSAVGLHEALPEKFASRQVLLPLPESAASVDGWFRELVQEARQALGDPSQVEVSRLAEVRLQGQDTPLQVACENAAELPALYASAYQRLFGYPPPAGRAMELVSLRVAVRAGATERVCSAPPAARPLGTGPMLLQDAFSTLVVADGWEAAWIEGFGHVLTRQQAAPVAEAAFQRDLVRHRLHGIVTEMGALLCRTSISTNIRERLDFSCALLDAKGRLVSSAPHIPVHLGALGVCVRAAVAGFQLRPGDTLVTNHPAYGGSHLPDVTLITPVFDADLELLGYVANRAHHAEIGGLTPGSMPATATCLAEEGVVLAPQYLVRAGQSCFGEVACQLTGAVHPTRNLSDNLADLHAQLAANQLGVERLRELAGNDSSPLRAALAEILAHSAIVLRDFLPSLPSGAAEQQLDDGSVLRVRVEPVEGRLRLDFSGSAPTHPRNLNATRAIVHSVVLYSLRLLLREDLPLNEGLLEPVDLILPEGTLLNPVFSGDPSLDPAVVGGNVEVSQRLVDTLLLAFGLQACSQGTMNNLLFGDGRFGYYETVAGGTGAGPEGAGADGVHSHMTNTAITDPEILEQRYPVRLRRFALRRGSGGDGRHRGGDGVVREFEFLAPLTVSLLTQHRAAGPYGLAGGADGLPGRQVWIRDEWETELAGCVSLNVRPGDRLRLETPGGGGWGQD
jgi:5-oxoprolinase (ATP-hydrolysing)